ncbi:MAG: hypothetical protein ACP5GU_08725 [Thermoprotei archaeon]
MKSNSIPRSLFVTLIAICASLYAVAAYLTAYIESPWGMGQFRPAVVIPLLFSTFNPWIGAVGGALGTLITDSIKHGYIYPPSLIAAVPGHIIGLSLYGYMVRKFTWTRFIIASIISLIIANFIVAVLYIPYVTGIFNVPLIIGLTLWWYITMLPFALFVGPILIKAVVSAVPILASQDLRNATLKSEIPKIKFMTVLVVSGSLMILIGLSFLYYPNLGSSLLLKKNATDMITTMFTFTGGASLIIGLIFGLSTIIRKT